MFITAFYPSLNPEVSARFLSYLGHRYWNLTWSSLKIIPKPSYIDLTPWPSSNSGNHQLISVNTIVEQDLNEPDIGDWMNV